jgi:hypothetical protein
MCASLHHFVYMYISTVSDGCPLFVPKSYLILHIYKLLIGDVKYLTTPKSITETSVSETETAITETSIEWITITVSSPESFRANGEKSNDQGDEK